MTALIVSCGGTTPKMEEPPPASPAAPATPITITHMTEHCNTWPETSTPLLDEIDQRLGVDWEHVPCIGMGYTDKLRMLFAANDLPDVFETYWIEEIIQQRTADLSVAEVQMHMPTYWKGLSTFASKSGLDLDFTLKRYERDGVLKHYPMVWLAANHGYGFLWRKDYLDELGMDSPTNLQEWEDVFAAYKSRYPDRYSYGTNQQFYRAFTAVTHGFGLASGRFLKKGSRLVYSQAQSDMIEVLQVLRRWYEAGYLAPDLEVNSESEPFESGGAIVKGWEHPSLPPDHPDFRADMKAANPGARFVLTGPPRVAGRFPVIYAWHPMHGNAHGIARRNNGDRGRVHAILQAVDALLEKENAYLINYGIEGTHWTLGANNRPQWTEEFAEDDARSGLGLGVLGRSVPLGLNIFALLGDPDWIDSERVDYLNQVRFSPNGVLGSNNVCVLTQSFVNAVEGGTDLRAANSDLIDESATLFWQIIAGDQPVSAYQDWIDRYNAGPGLAIERAATRNWAHLVPECPS
ncbi:MAG: hypothetical protein OXQ31_02390 [Spirochaetaceae bacterium]|nr:hypothetical protein [Spirochaetaceae bacterium]